MSVMQRHAAPVLRRGLAHIASRGAGRECAPAQAGTQPLEAKGLLSSYGLFRTLGMPRDVAAACSAPGRGQAMEATASRAPVPGGFPAPNKQQTQQLHIGKVALLPTHSLSSFSTSSATCRAAPNGASPPPSEEPGPAVGGSPLGTPSSPCSPEPPKPPPNPDSPPPPDFLTRARKFVLQNFLPLAFASALAAALVWPDPGRALVELRVLDGVRIAQVLPMALVFLITGLQLDTSDMRRALSPTNAPAVLYGLVAILALTPLLGFVLRELPLEPKEFATGLAVFSVAPTTLGVGVALTAACGGNQALALLLTVATNAAAVFTMPPELQLLLPPSEAVDGAAAAASAAAAADIAAVDTSAATGAVNVDVYDLLAKLAATVLIPFAIGKTAREALPSALAFAKSHRIALSLFSTSCLAFVVWQTLSACRDLLLEQQPGPLAAMVAAAVGMHLTYLAANYAVVWHVLRPPLREAIAVTIMASQKSAPVAVTVISYLSNHPAQQGLLAMPAVVGQLAQIFIGAGLASRLAKLATEDAGKRSN